MLSNTVEKIKFAVPRTPKHTESAQGFLLRLAVSNGRFELSRFAQAALYQKLDFCIQPFQLTISDEAMANWEKMKLSHFNTDTSLNSLNEHSLQVLTKLPHSTVSAGFIKEKVQSQSDLCMVPQRQRVMVSSLRIAIQYETINIRSVLLEQHLYSV